MRVLQTECPQYPTRMLCGLFVVSRSPVVACIVVVLTLTVSNPSAKKPKLQLPSCWNWRPAGPLRLPPSDRRDAKGWVQDQQVRRPFE